MLPNLNPDQLAGAYEFLRTLEPFNAYALPHADEIEFIIAADPRLCGWHKQKPATKTHIIAISHRNVGLPCTLLRIMAHEMIHLTQAIYEKRNHKSQHNAEFKRLATAVCEIQGYDLKLFI